jgi:hypothetical protein
MVGTEAELVAMPLLIINMGGEMLYILEQRLKAQNIPEDKGLRVHQDVMSTMFSDKFVTELFKSQKIYSNSSTRLIFDRLAHSSIMRLNESSMNKLYDLMSMGCKYQVLAATHAEQLEHISLNHLEALEQMVIKKPEVVSLLTSAKSAAATLFKSLSPADWILLRQTLSRFFQDRRVKVSLFLHDGLQSSDGSIVIQHKGPLPPGAEKPGTIRYFDSDGNVKNEEKVDMKNATDVKPTEKRSSLGENLYAKDRRKKGNEDPKKQTHKNAPMDKDKPFEPDEKDQERAKKELNLLATMLGGTQPSTTKDKFTLSQLFPDAGAGGEGRTTGDVITFDDRDAKDYKTLLMSGSGFWGDELVNEEEDDEEDDDLLALMDMSDIYAAQKGGSKTSGGALGPTFARKW